MPSRLQDLELLDTLAMSAVDGRSSLLLIGPQGQEYTLQHQPRYVADDLLTLKFAVLAGTGMGWLPDYMCHDECNDGRLVHLMPEWSPPRGVVHAVFPSRRGLSPAVRSFLDFLGESMPGHTLLA
ncbi:transcriptional regulator [compost metagenome]